MSAPHILVDADACPVVRQVEALARRHQLAMTLLERNKQGDLDYKSISKLYELEGRFDDHYKAIMDLFRESNVVQANAVNYYFYRRDEQGVWRQLEPSFCRL